MNRRHFLQSGTLLAGAAMAGPMILPAAAKGANDRVRLASIGTGGKGRHGMTFFLGMKDVDLVAVCDVYQPSLQAAVDLTQGKAKPYHDFREILSREDIDAVHIATPDHWHAIPMILACQAGKDVFVEKPLSLVVAEGRRMVEAARANSRIVQAGTQQRSGSHFREAASLVASGAIGKVTMVETWSNENITPVGIGNPKDEPPPPNLDWEMWLGPAPDRPFNWNRFRHFRWFKDYSGGKMTDWGVHLIDIVQWAIGVDAPLTVSATGGKFCLKDNRDTPDTIHVTWEYPECVVTFTSRLAGVGTRPSYGIEFLGTEGSLFLDRAGWRITPETIGSRERMEPSQSGGSAQNGPHEREFIDCIRSRQLPVSDVEICHKSTVACLIANISLEVGKKLYWDANQEKFKNCDEANQLLDYTYRSPWSNI